VLVDAEVQEGEGSFMAILILIHAKKSTMRISSHPWRQVLGILNANKKICKHMDTNVAFTREYSKVSIFHGEYEVY